MNPMRKRTKVALLALAAVMTTVVVLVPVAVPPLVKSVAERKLAEFGFPARITMKLGYTWRKGPEVTGSLQAALLDSPWRLQTEFGAGFGEWHARVNLPETAFSESDPTLAKLLAEHPQDAVTNLAFSGTIALDASVERTRATPVPVWSARVPIRNVSVSCLSDETPLSVSGLSVTPKASGIAGHVDLAPTFLHAACASAAGFAITNLTASILPSERRLLVTEATAGVCDGKVSLYSLFLDPQTLNAGLTLFLDNVDAGKVLSHFNGFHGEASGRLHGKVRLFLRNGKTLRLSDAFLYSTPGETGKVKMEDAAVVTDNLALAGIDEDSRSNVANALADLDYTVLRFDLKRTNGKAATLSVRVEGTATRGELTVPVNLTLNFNGELEQLINTGLDYTRKLKGYAP